MVIKNKNLFIPILFFISSVNIIFYPITVNLGIIDEIVVLLLFIFGFKIICNKEFLAILFILIFYLIYSLIWGQNIYQAVLLDFILFLKPFIAFFVPYLLSVTVTSKDKKRIKSLFLLGGIFCVIQLPFIERIYSNTAAYYSCCIFSAFPFLLFSDLNKKNIFIALIILTFGLASIRAKYFTEFLFIIFVFFFLKGKIKINIKWIIIMTILSVIAIYISWNKFHLYFISGIEEEVARSMFYYLIPQIVIDYIPFGPGFGTFNTEAAAMYYSPLYSQYNIDHIWGIRSIDYNTNSDFLKDTFYPALSQFGILGFILYFKFWYRRWNEGYYLDMNRYKIFIIIFFILLIQNIADNSFTGPTGVPYMMMLGLILSKKNNI